MKIFIPTKGEPILQYRDITDETLVMLTLAGEQSAYEKLVLRYQNAVIGSALQITRNRFMAEDAAQDAFVTAWIKLNTLQQPEKFGSWICRIVRNCAMNMVTRYRSFLPEIPLEDWDIADDPKQNPAELLAWSEEKSELEKSMEKLPEKVGRIIYLHYFEGLSVAEIADRMCVSAGTVKRQLHDGRKRIRKELCAMDETYNDTLIQRVMKKVEELKLWQVKTDKTGFEAVYKDVLKDVEDLPESDSKYHALADVLMRGWWWLPGEKNDALFARIKETALQGKNDEVMEFIVTREDSQVWGNAKIEFIRDRQIPMLEKAGFIRTLAREWFWLGYQYFRDGQTENGYAAFDKVQSLLTPADRYYALTMYAREVEEKMAAGYKDKNQKQFLLRAFADELRQINGGIRYWKGTIYDEGQMSSVEREVSNLFWNASRCDGWFFDEKMAVGETRRTSDITGLTYASAGETVETPCCVFTDCHLWITKWLQTHCGYCICRTWYKEGVGIVKQERISDGCADVRLLKSCQIVGGNGLLPMAAGNTWEYADTYNHDCMVSELRITVTHADEDSVMIASADRIERFRYDGNSWLDMMQQIRNEYWIHEDGKGKIGDITHALECAETLAVTPMEKAHTKAAVSVARRIMETNAAYNPAYTATGHWNFFGKEILYRKGNRIHITGNTRWSFELKKMSGAEEAARPLLYNDILGILEDAVKCVWDDAWITGYSETKEISTYRDRNGQTQVLCEDGGTIITQAGTFENCLKLSLDIEGMEDGWAYRGGKKVYWFAPGIGIVRTESEYSDGARTAVYELTAYEGTGNGYMPMADGMMRRYDAQDLTDGYIGAAVYTWVEAGDGMMSVFADRTGIRQKQAPVTRYSSIEGEVLEDTLFDDGKWQEGHLRHGINSFNLMQHYIFRKSWHFNNANRSVEVCRFNMNLMESFGENGEVPPAWYGIYGWSSLVKSAALFGDGRKDEGYLALECAFEYYVKWNSIEDETLLEVGNPEVFGNIRLLKARGQIELPDGTREPVTYGNKIRYSSLWTALNSPNVWAWFNPVREEERFKAYIERAKKLMENNK